MQVNAQGAKIDERKLLIDILFLSALSIEEDSRLPLILERTTDFEHRTRRVPYRFFERENYHTRVKDRSYRHRRHQRKKGAHSHLRNFRPEIPNAGGARTPGFSGLESVIDSVKPENFKPFISNNQLFANVTDGPLTGVYRVGELTGGVVVDPHHFKPYTALEAHNLIAKALLHYKGCEQSTFYRDHKFYAIFSKGKEKIVIQLDFNEDPAYVHPKTLATLHGSAIQSMLEYLDENHTSPRYSRPHSNEPSQTRPKIPFREIPAIRKRTPGKRRAKYMVTNMPKGDSDSYRLQEPVLMRHTQVINYSQEGRKVTMRTTTWHYTPLVRMG